MGEWKSLPGQSLQARHNLPHNLSVEMMFILMDLPMAKLIKLANMAGAIQEADHAYSIQNTW